MILRPPRSTLTDPLFPYTTRFRSVGMITEWMSDEGLQKRGADTDLGGTMRLGAYEAKLSPNSHVASVYGANDISERHRHRYEVNGAYREQLEKGGLEIGRAHV